MKKKQIMALALVIAMSVGAAGTLSFRALAAADFTQAQTPSQVNYGKLTAEELAIAKENFDAKAYAEKYDDVVEALGTDEDLLFEHFRYCGIFEGRKGCTDFDPSAYACAYPELKEKFGADLPKYYVHYYTTGKAEGRNLTTIEACEAAGIKVVSFFNPDALLPVNVFAASNLMGTADYNTVQDAVSAATTEGAAVVNTETETYVVVPIETAEAMEENGSIVKEGTATEEPHFEVTGTICVNGDQECAILLLKNDTGLETKIIYDMTAGATLDPSRVVGIVPVVVFSVEQANAIIEGEIYEDIPTFDVEGGNVIGTEGVTIKEDYSGFEYEEPETFEAPNKKMMTNYTDQGYVDNAPVGVDENGTDDAEYSLGAYHTVDEDGATLTTIITNEDGFSYEVSYKFKGDFETKAVETENTATESEAETTETAETEAE